jgi:hypothetical protein
VDVFTINLPAETPMGTNERAYGIFYPEAWGVNFNGSTAPLGPMWVVDPADPTHHLVEIQPQDTKNAPPMQLPLSLSQPHYLYVTRAAGTPGDREFYYVYHYSRHGRSLETDQGAGANFVAKNDTPATAEVMTLIPNYTTVYGVDGDLSASQDVDYFSASIPAGLTNKTVTPACEARVFGSGLRGLKLSVFKSDGTTLLANGSTATESATQAASILNIPLGTETTGIVLKLEATQPQDTNITATHYGCTASFK